MYVCLYYWLSYTTFKSHIFCVVLSVRLWPVWMLYICKHYLVNRTAFEKKIIKQKMCVLIFFTFFF
jgi:hypothetical protein